MRDFEDYCWRAYVSDEVREIYSAYVRERAVGPRPAMLVVHPGEAATSGAWQAPAEKLLQAMRARSRPVLHSVPPHARPLDALRPAGTEAVVARPCESAFFSSDLDRALRAAGAASLVVCGAPSSGAVRATAVEGKSWGYAVAIAEETVGDRSPFLHAIALFDMAHKYADVMSLEELLAQP
jgi:nicotinamidase-related amidase